MKNKPHRCCILKINIYKWILNLFWSQIQTDYQTTLNPENLNWDVWFLPDDSVDPPPLQSSRQCVWFLYEGFSWWWAGMATVIHTHTKTSWRSDAHPLLCWGKKGEKTQLFIKIWNNWSSNSNQQIPDQTFVNQ